MPALQLDNIRKTFGATVALARVDLEVNAGEVLAIIGENGAGKSTLLNIIAGVFPPDSGTLHRPSGRVAYIRQELSLFPHMTVAENILMGHEPSRWGFIDRTSMATRATKLLSAFGRDTIEPWSRIRDLSPANRQVIEICRALDGDAKVILMDEPTSSLQRADVDRLFATIRTLCDRGIAVVYVSHFLEEIREVARRAVVLRDGSNVWNGSLDTITDDGLIAQMIGSALHTKSEAAVRRFGDVVLDACGVRVRGGEIVGIAGLIGAGRTELLRRIYDDPYHSIQRGIGYLSEDRNAEGLFPQLSVQDNIRMTRPHDRQVSSWIEQLRIRTAGPLSPVRNLSGGNQQKVLFARLLHQHANVLLLDEPTRGIDVGSKAEIYDHIRCMAREGKGVLIVSSYLPELFEICDSIAVMSRGKLSPARPVAEWTPDSVLDAAIGEGSVR